MEAALQKPTPAVADTAQPPTGAEHYFTPVSPFQTNSKSNREGDVVTLNTDQPATYIGKGSVRSFLPSKIAGEDRVERNGHQFDSQKIFHRDDSLIPSKPLNGRQHTENGTRKNSQDLPRRKMAEPRMELNVPDLRPLSPPLILDYSSFDRTFDGTFDGSYDDLLAPMSDLDTAFMISDQREKSTL